ncbi:hypothetical protein CEUSTIGMA_g8477.t1 [Chlamydomonas eustigma]|uniref:Sister chromatid cohesion protein n=1 Tax=Chlamydomonas eustigma TaxID=1157962 RepID=A0A250XDS9_9CHLO|nr:hypothetical protein CEUSTIGMA_g8477.t1 [Chlamydomonas eustigma]|eukprot:GAX81042.1 hypothetical protein CEUSTIGMA_g8477.t1 [Chlamydomonas eustigma]
MDQGLSVRKRAIKVLWDCCVLCPGGFPRLDEAVMIILHRVGDNEESMRKLAQNLCCQLWFSSDHELITQDATSTIAAFPSVLGGTLHPSSSSDDRSPLSRAKQLASVCYAVHLAEGGLPHTPPSPDNAVLMLLRGVLGRGGISKHTAMTPAAAAVQATTREGAEAVVKALMAWYLQLHDAAVLDPGPAHQAQLTALMALHALASADVSVCLPRKDPPAHIKCLAPYLKERPTEGSCEDAKRCCAGRLLYINSFISLAAKGLDVLDASLSEVIAHDLQDMITRHQFVGVVNSACQCLCVLARLNSATLAPKVHEVLARHYRQLDRDYQAGCTSSSKWKPFYSRWLLVMGQLCRHGASIIDQVAEQLLLRQQQQLELQNSSTSMGLSSFSGAAGSTLEPSHSYSGVTSLMASGSGSSSTVLLPAVGSSQCMTLFLQYLDLADDDHEGLLDGSSKAARVMGGFVKLCDSAMQALGLLFISKPDLMLADSAVMSVMETALEASSTIGQSSGMSTASTLSLQCLSAGGGASARALTGTVSENMSRCLRRDALKRRVLGNLVEMLRAEEDLMEERQAKAVQEHANSQLASTLPASDDHGEGHRPLARINGEGDASSLTSSVVQKLWPKILALARDVPPAATSGAASKQGGTRAPPHGDVYADAAGLALKGDRGAAVRRKVVDLIEVVQRGGLTAPWQCVAPLVALSSDLNSDTAAKALKLLKQCVDKHADYVGSELSPGIMHSYVLQRRLYEAEHGAGSFGKSDDLPEEAGHHLVAMWSSVIQPHASLKNKMLTALMRPFEDASNTAGPGALTSDPGLLWYSTWLSSRLAYRRMDEPLSLLSTLSGVLARRSEAVLTELKDALEEQKKLRGSSSSSRVDAPGGDGAAAAAASTAVSDSAVALEDVIGGGMGAVPGGSVEVLPCGGSVDAVPYDVGVIQGLMAARDSFLWSPSGGPTGPGIKYGLEDNAAANSPGEGHHGAPDKVLAGQGCESSVCVLDCPLPAMQEAGAASAVILTAAAHEKQATAVLSSSASITASTSLQAAAAAAAAATSTTFQVADASFARASSAHHTPTGARSAALVHHTPTGARSAALPFTARHHQFTSSPSFNQLTPQVSGSLSYNSASVSMAVNVSAAAVAAASVPGMTSRLVGAVKASAALSLLLLLKQYLFRAYRLTEERVAGLTGNAQGRKNEAKVSAVRDLRVPHLRLHVIDLEAHQDVSLKGAKEQYKTLKYLLSEDVHLCGSSVLINSDNGIEADSRGRPEMMLANETKKTPVSATRSSKQGYAGGKPPKSTTKSKFGQGSTVSGTKGRLVLKGKRGKRRRSSSYEEDDTSEEGVDNDGTQAAQLGEREAIHANEECSRSVRKKTGGSRKTRSEASSVGNLEEDMEG